MIECSGLTGKPKQLSEMSHRYLTGTLCPVSMDRAKPVSQRLRTSRVASCRPHNAHRASIFLSAPVRHSAHNLHQACRVFLGKTLRDRHIEVVGGGGGDQKRQVVASC